MYITPKDNASMKEILLLRHKQKLCKTQNVESKRNLPPTKYIMIANRINYTKTIIKNRSLIHLNLNTKLDPENLNCGELWTIMDIVWSVAIILFQSTVGK